MTKIYRLGLIFLTAVLCFSFGTAVWAQVGGATVQTNFATNIYSNQATLSGYLSIPYYNSASNYVYFEWGTTTSYNNQTAQQYLNGSGSFVQVITGLNYNTTYHFRAVAQVNGGIIYGQDMTFYVSGSGYYGNGTLTVDKKVINITGGNLAWQTAMNANPLDILTFAITLQANNQDVHNVIVRDILPANLIYNGNLMVNVNPNYGGNISSGVNIGTVYANQPIVVSYQAQVAEISNFAYGATTLNNSATITSTEAGTQTASATVVVNRATVYGVSDVSDVSTGLTNNFLADSFFLPLLIILTGAWVYSSGRAKKQKS